MKNKINKIISKLFINQNKNKKIIFVRYEIYHEKILNLLWKNGFIRGFNIIFKKFKNKNYFFFKIFLKYSEKNKHLFRKLFFFNFLSKNKKLKKIARSEKNYTFFILNNKGFFLHKSCLKQNLGGFIFVKI